MHLLKSYPLTDPEFVINLRRDVDNILEWGLNLRFEYIKQCLAKIKANDPKFKRLGPSKAAESESNVQCHATHDTVMGDVCIDQGEYSYIGDTEEAPESEQGTTAVTADKAVNNNKADHGTAAATTKERKCATGNSDE
jgi:hypothetical protein